MLVNSLLPLFYSAFYYSRSPNEQYGLMKIIDIYEKARELYLSLVLHIEALALPTTAERATQKPTPICTHNLLLEAACQKGKPYIPSMRDMY